MPEVGSPQDLLLRETIKKVRQLVLGQQGQQLLSGCKEEASSHHKHARELAPLFLPHLTLLGIHPQNDHNQCKDPGQGEDQVVALAHLLARSLPPLHIQLPPPSSSSTSSVVPLECCPFYYRCLFLPVSLTSSVRSLCFVQSILRQCDWVNPS